MPAPVAEEILARGTGDTTARAIRENPWLEVARPRVPDEIASWGLGPGEAAVLAIALANPGMTAIIDDLGGRKCAACLHVPVRGTLGIVLAAKRRGIVPLARPVLDDLLASGLYLSRSVLNEALKRGRITARRYPGPARAALPFSLRSSQGIGGKRGVARRRPDIPDTPVSISLLDPPLYGRRITTNSGGMAYGPAGM